MESRPESIPRRKQEKNRSCQPRLVTCYEAPGGPDKRVQDVMSLHGSLGPAASERNVSLAFLAHRRYPDRLEERGPLFQSHVLDLSGSATLSILAFTPELNLRQKEVMEHCRTGHRQEPKARWLTSCP